MKGLKKVRLDKSILYVAAADIIFILLLIGCVYLLNSALFANIGSLEQAYPTFEKIGEFFYQEAVPGSAEAFTAELEAAEALMQRVILNSILLLVLFFVLVVALISFFKGIIWAIISGQRFSFRYFRKFLLLNYIWLGFWVLVFILSLVLFKENMAYYVMGFELLLFIYTTSVIRSVFNEEESIFRVLKKGIGMSFKVKLLPLIFIVIGFIIIALVGYLLFLAVKGYILISLLLVLFAFYSALARRYLSSLHLV